MRVVDGLQYPALSRAFSTILGRVHRSDWWLEASLGPWI